MQTMQKSQIAGGRCVRPSRAPMRVSALFGKKAAAAVLEREAPATKSSKAKAKAKTKAKTTTKEEPKRKQQSFMSQTLDAFDFSSVRSEADADLLYQAKYGKQADENGKYRMSREQYGALRRKVGGTGKDFFKEWVEEERPNAYMKPSDSSASVPFLPILVGVVLALLGTTVYVVSQTS